MRFDRQGSIGLLALVLTTLTAPLASAQLFDRHEEYYQAGPLFGGTVEAHDFFGSAMAAGDFNGDGKDDLAIGQTNESSDANGGYAYVLYAWDPAAAVGHGEFSSAQEWRQGAGSAGDTANPGNGFGGALAAGDFDGDGYQDLAIGAYLDTVFGQPNAGLVHILYGTSGFGLSSARRQVWNQTDASPGIEPVEQGDYFGIALAVGDFNHDGKDDLAISAEGEDIGSATNAGMVHVLYGSASGLSTAGVQSWRQQAGGLGGVVQTGDFFGSSLATGDFDGDGWDDLAVGIQGETIGGASAAGAVQIIRGSSGGLVFTGNQLLHEDNIGLAEVAENGDWFGRALAAGDFDGDGRDELAIGAPGEGIETLGLPLVGKVFVLKGTATGLSGDGGQVWIEAFSGGDGASASDYFGYTLAAADFDGNGSADLAIGMPFEDLELTGGGVRADTGQVLVVYSTLGFGLDLSRPKQRFVEFVGGLGGEPLAGDQFGTVLVAGDFDGDGVPSLAISTPWENLFGLQWAGVVHVLEDGLVFQDGFESNNLSHWVVGGICPSCR